MPDVLIPSTMIFFKKGRKTNFMPFRVLSLKKMTKFAAKCICIYPKSKSRIITKHFGEIIAKRSIYRFVDFSFYRMGIFRLNKMSKKRYVVPVTDVTGILVDYSVLQGSGFGEDFGEFEDGARRRGSAIEHEETRQGVRGEKDSWKYMRVNSLW